MKRRENMQLIKVKVVEESKGILEYFDDDKKIWKRIRRIY